MASGWSLGIAIFERGRSTRRLLHLNIFATQWHCPCNFLYSINTITILFCLYYFRLWLANTSSLLPHRFRDTMALHCSNKGQDEANKQLTYETDPHFLFPTLTLQQRQVYET